MADEAKIKSLKAKIAKEEDPEIKTMLEAKLAELEDAGDDGYLEADFGEETMDNAGGQFPCAGEWPAVFGKPSIYKSKSSFVFPFSIPAPGYTAPFALDGMADGPQGKLYPGRTAASAWKLKEILTALGVQWSTNPDTGNVRFKPADVEGKVGKVVYKIEGTYPDPLTGKQVASTIATPQSVIPVGSTESAAVPF
jgi:hypothetical protein